MIQARILVHHSDAEIVHEIRSAVAAIDDLNASMHFHTELRNTINAVTNYQPNLVIIEIAEDFDSVKTIVNETLAAVPNAAILGVYDASRLTTNVSESTLMLQSLRLGVEDFLRRPIASADFVQVLQNRLSPRRAMSGELGKIASFISNKGGVGKSTCSINTAVGLATFHSERVALIDCSLQMGVCGVQLNMEPEATLVNAWEERDRLDEKLLTQLMTVHESGLHVLCAPPSAIDAAEIDDAFLSRILLMARRTYDYVIVDTFPMFDRTVMTILDLSDHAFIVLENIVPTLQMVKGFLSLLEEFDFAEEKQRIVLNRYSSRSGSPAIGDVTAYLGMEPDFVIPVDRRFISAANTGKPFIGHAPRWNRAASVLRAMVDEIAEGTKRADALDPTKSKATFETAAGASSDSSSSEG